MKDWTRSDTLALAYSECVACRGTGIRLGRRGEIHPCNCVLRSIFRICYNRFRYCVETERHIPPTTLERGACGSQSRRYLWSRKEEEFVADFHLVSKRYLSKPDWEVFRFHFLLGADWKMCCRRLNMDRGTFFHAIYRIEHRLGRIFRDLEPYGLFPLDEYFGGSSRRNIEDDAVAAMENDADYDEYFPAQLPTDMPKRVIPIRPPVQAKPEINAPDTQAA